MTRSKLGIILLATPAAAIVFILPAYAISSFVFSAMLEANPTSESYSAIGKIVSIGLSLLGVAAIVCIPIGLALLVMGDKKKK